MSLAVSDCPGLWFGPQQRPRFGHYHPPSPQCDDRHTGIVLCPAFGYEDVCSHRAYRFLAGQLANVGFSVLRFDYDGTGDSAGYSHDTARVSTWSQDIELAVDELRRLSQCRHVSLFGMRLGGLLAIEAARTSTIESLVLWAVPRSGRKYSREMTLLSGEPESPPAAIDTHLNPSRPLEERDRVAAGFLLSGETLEAIAKLTPLEHDRPSTPAVLVIDRDDQAPDQKLAQHFEKLGATVEYAVRPGFAELQTDPHKTEIPREVFDHIGAWLQQRHPVPALNPKSSEPVTTSTQGGSARGEACWRLSAEASIRESALELDARNGKLRGILTQPANPEGAGDSEAVLLVNSGAVRRIGPNRIHTELARQWAEAEGKTTLRIDLAGLGESDGSEAQAEHLYNDSVIPDARVAIDELQRRGFSRITIVGLCSGAYVAYHSALVDDRVARVVMINPQTFYFRKGASLDVERRQAGKAAQHYRTALRNRDNWLRLVKGDVNVHKTARALGQAVFSKTRDRLTELKGRVIGFEANRVERDFQKLLGRGVDLRLLYSQYDPGVDYLFAYLGRDLHRLGSARRQIDMTVVPGPDHTFSAWWARAWLSSYLTQVIQSPIRTINSV